MSNYKHIVIERSELNKIELQHHYCESKEQRFGQYFINQISKQYSNITCPSIFYCNDDKKAYQLIEQTFTIKENGHEDIG